MRTRSIHFTLALVAAATLARAQDSSTIQNWGAPPSWAAAGTEIPTGPLQFVGITPCRLLDTRGNGFAGPWGPPLLASGVARNFPVAGQCGIPANAQAVSANLGVTLTQGAGFLLIHPQGGAMPLVSSINYERAGQTIANAAVIPLGEDGGITVVAGVASTQFFVDVNGYYAPQAMVTNVNGLSGELELVAGANITLTPGSGAITISSSAVGAIGPQGPVGPQGGAGPQGPTGPQGTAGLQGAQGATGPAGPQGVAGAVGAQGPAGPQGTQGDAGPVGPVGATWRSSWDGGTAYAPGDVVALGGASYIALAVNTGAQPDVSLGTSWDLVAARGADGATGTTGAIGPQGSAGATGDVGPQGPAGATGATGAIGAQGPVGATGVQGPKGDTGVTGDVGPQGPVGATGAQGLKGDTGSTGDVGPQGPVGPTGAQGPKGDTGATGDVGPQGPAGATGATGAIGPQGPVGATGATGAQGPKGDTGATGDVGPQGPVGATGAQGAKGDTGAQGSTGLTGAQGPQGVPGTSAALVAGNHPNVTDGEFLMPWDITQSGTEGSEDVPVAAGTANKLIFRMGTALTSGQTATITLRKNGVDTAVTCTIPNSGTSCTDYVHTATYVDGDSLSIKYNETGSTKPAGRVKYSFLYATQ